ncbi:MAG TPA: hypothetical protein VHB79_37555 [Polyangiaceae bacterium]|nr:hypothetical protein [Polyangiaceae bacterium]
MKSYGVLGGVCLGVLAFAAACGGDDHNPPQNMAGSSTAGSAGQSAGAAGDESGGEGGSSSSTGGSSAGTGGSSAGTGGSGGTAMVGGNGGSGGSGGVPAAGFQSRPAGIALELDAKSKAAGFTLTTSSITQETTGDLNYVEWLGELVNGTSKTQCLIAISGDFQNAAGTSVTKLDTYAYGPAYDIGLGKLVSTCAAPGEHVPIWSNDLPDVAIDVDSIKKLVVTINPIEKADAKIHPSTPTLSEITKTYSSTFKTWQLAGTATAVADIYNVKITMWGKSGDFFVDSADAFHLDDYLEGTQWAFDTAPLGIESETLTKVIPYFSFLDGLQGAARWVYSEEVKELAATRELAVQGWDAARARREQVRNQTAP